MSTNLGYNAVPGARNSSDLMGAFGSAVSGQGPAKQSIISILMPTRQISSTISGVTNLTRNANAPVGDLPSIKASVSGMKQQAQADLGAMKAGWDCARQDAITCAKGIAADNLSMGITASMIDHTFMQTSPGLAAAGVLAGAGLGSAATFGVQIASAAHGLKNADKGMSSSQRAQLAEEMAVQANNSPSLATMQAMGGAQANIAQFEGFDAKQFEALLGDQFDEQPEAEELNSALYALAQVEDNHASIEKDPLLQMAEDYPVTVALVDEMVAGKDQVSRMKLNSTEAAIERPAAMNRRDVEARLGVESAALSPAEQAARDAAAEQQRQQQQSSLANPFAPPTPPNHGGHSDTQQV